MPRAERSHDLGEVFRRKVEDIIRPLRYDILASKFPIKCKCEYHGTTEHTLDILARHVHAAESSRKKTIIVESKKTMPALSSIENMVVDLANKVDCLCKHSYYSEIDEALVLTESDMSLRALEEFNKASTKIASSRDTFIAVICGSRFRGMEGMSNLIRQYSDSSVTIINAGKNPSQDIGSPCPLNIDYIQKHYVCALKPPKFRISVFKMNTSYNSHDFVEDMAWVKNYQGVLDQIHACESFTDSVSTDVSSSGLTIGLIDHTLQRTFYVDYLNYHREGS